MRDFTPSPSASLSSAINERIDAALQEQNAKQEHRDYLGASRLGVECMRQLYFELREPDKAAPFPGRVLRRFRLGHLHEDETACWLGEAGFELATVDPATNEQWSFRNGSIGGHADGQIFGGPVPLPYPVMWEHKIMKSSSWAKFVKDGVAVSHPVYWAQCVVYGERFRRTHTLFTALNTDTSELWFELVANDVGRANAILERGRRIVAAKTEHDVPRVAMVETDWRCRWCSFAAHCWRPEATPPKPAVPGLPSWVR